MTPLDSVRHVPARTSIFAGSRFVEETVYIGEFVKSSVTLGCVSMFLLLHTQVAAQPVRVNLDRFAHSVRVPKHVPCSDAFSRHFEVNESETSHQ